MLERSAVVKVPCMVRRTPVLYLGHSPPQDSLHQVYNQFTFVKYYMNILLTIARFLVIKLVKEYACTYD